MIPPDPRSRLRHLQATGQVDLPGDPRSSAADAALSYGPGSSGRLACSAGDGGSLAGGALRSSESQ